VSAHAAIGEPPPLWQHPAFRVTLAVALLAAAGVALAWTPIADALLTAEFAVADAFGEQWIRDAAWLALPAVGMAAGLLASLSPCILPLVPLNVAYIGAAEAEGWQAVGLSARFVVGAAAALSVLGLFGDLAGVLLIDQRGPVLLAVGLVIAYLGLASLELAPLPVSLAPGGSRRLGAFGAGAAFSLLTTPCASPLLAAVLAAAAAQGQTGLTVASMIGFALGYTALVFAAGAFGGGAVQRLRRHSFAAPRAAAGALMLVIGGAFAAAGATWFA